MSVNKSRYWWAVLYEENMVEGWEDKIDDILQLPYCYIKHDKDTDKKSEHRKNHIHCLVAWNSPTTYKHALNVFKELGEKAVNTCQACICVRHCYDYLIHNTEKCKKQNKHLYDESERVEGNNFDIGAYEQISMKEKRELLKELLAFAVKSKITNFADFTAKALEWDSIYFEIFVGYNSMFEKVVRGNYLKAEAESEKKKLFEN